MQNLRRKFLQGVGGIGAGGVLLALGCGGGGSPNAAAKDNPNAATLNIKAGQPLRPVNRLVLGNNIDWTYEGQGMMATGANSFVPERLALADRLAPTVLRFPGGTNADFYHWRDAVGPVQDRKEIVTLEGNTEFPGLGTDEFLDLCQRWNAEALITVNVATGTPEEAAAWVRYANLSGRGTPRVKYWEIGNEPYLEAHFPEAAMSPAEYARRANLFIRAMKQVDPGIQVGLPLRSDTLGGHEATPFPGFNDVVLGAVTEPYEFVALHSSYFPVTFDKSESTRDLFLATMAGTSVMQDDMVATRAALRKHRPGATIKLAFTEFNALYSLDILRWGLASLWLSRTDRYIESLAGALFVADALRVYSLTDDLLMSNFWSISGNWWFGAIGHDGLPRPQFHVLEAYRDMMRGSLIACDVATPTIETAAAGFVPAREAIPSVVAHAVRDGDTLRLAIINRNPDQAMNLSLRIDGMKVAAADARELNAPDYFSAEVGWSRKDVAFTSGEVRVEIGAHAFAMVTLRAV